MEETSNLPTDSLDTPTKSLPPELDAALKVVRRYAVLYAAQQGKTESEVFASLINLDHTVPLEWSGKGYYTYYKEPFARKIQKILDGMIVAKTNKFISKHEWGVSVNTMSMMAVHGWLYLRERLDTPEHKYSQLRSMIEIAKQGQNGLLFEWKARLIDKINFVSEGENIPIVTEVNLNLKSELLDWLETGEDETVFEKDRLRLSEEQIQYIHDLCEGAPNVIVDKVKPGHVKIIKSSYLMAARKKNRGEQ